MIISLTPHSFQYIIIVTTTLTFRIYCLEWMRSLLLISISIESGLSSRRSGWMKWWKRLMFAPKKTLKCILLLINCLLVSVPIWRSPIILIFQTFLAALAYVWFPSTFLIFNVTTTCLVIVFCKRNFWYTMLMLFFTSSRSYCTWSVFINRNFWYTMLMFLFDLSVYCYSDIFLLDRHFLLHSCLPLVLRTVWIYCWFEPVGCIWIAKIFPLQVANFDVHHHCLILL